MLPPFSVVVPAFNEASRIGETLRLTIAYLTTVSPESEIIVVNDGSTDETSRVAREALANGLQLPLDIVMQPGEQHRKGPVAHAPPS